MIWFTGSAFRLSGRILLMSGSSGHVINWVGVPDDKESYYSPQLYTLPDGTQLVLFGTGGETHGGSLWVVKLVDLMRGDISKVRANFARIIYVIYTLAFLPLVF